MNEQWSTMAKAQTIDALADARAGKA